MTRQSRQVSQACHVKSVTTSRSSHSRQLSRVTHDKSVTQTSQSGQTLNEQKKKQNKERPSPPFSCSLSLYLSPRQNKTKKQNMRSSSHPSVHRSVHNHHRVSDGAALRVTRCTPLRVTSMAVLTSSRLRTSSTDWSLERTMSVWYCRRCYNGTHNNTGYTTSRAVCL